MPLRANLAFVLLTSAALAQPQFTSPPGFLSIEGESLSSSTAPFAYPSARLQVSDGGQRGTPRPALRRLELRRDGQQATSTVYGARTTNLAVLLAHCDVTALSSTFASNYAGAPTVVFTRKLVNLPNHGTAPATPPAAWTVTVPFDVTWSYNGTLDLLWELQSDGCSSSNLYSLDGTDGTTATSYGTSSYNGLQGCLVTPNTLPFDIFKVGPTGAAGTVTLGLYALRGPISRAGILVFGLSDPNTNLGGLLCARLRASADATVPVGTDATGALASSTTPLALTLPFTSSSLVTVYSQLALIDLTRQPPELPAALSDGIRWDLRVQPANLASRLFDSTSQNAATGSRSTFNLPIARLRD